MGILNLKGLDDAIAARKAVHERYMQNMADINSLRLPPVQEGVERNYAYFPVYFKGGKAVRDHICKVLADKGIFARKYFYPLTNDFQCYRGRPGFDSNLTPIAKRTADGIVTLPLYPELPLEEVDLICNTIRGVLCHD